MALRYKRITAVIRAESGFRIAGGEGDIGIGGVDENLRVLRDPVSKEPYIPGSSLKGKVRNLLEQEYGRRDKRGNLVGDGDSGEPCMCANCDVCRIFGPHKNTTHNLGPSRLIVRDAFLTPESCETLRELNHERGIDSVEVKTENMVDRKTGTALHPRPGERTLKGMEYGLRLSVRIIDDDDEQHLLGVIRRGFVELLPNDTIGGSGTRGYGEVTVTDWTVTDPLVPAGDGAPAADDNGSTADAAS